MMNDKERHLRDEERREQSGTPQQRDLDKDDVQPQPGTGAPMDLDGDGMIGNTGGFYGGTSYVGSNYGADWNTEDSHLHEGNYGAAGQHDDANVKDSDDDLPRDADR